MHLLWFNNRLFLGKKSFAYGKMGPMRVVILYRPDSEHARAVETFARDLRYRHDRRVELVNLSTRAGAAMATLYDAVQYPSILALADDGRILHRWEGPILPLLNDVVYYAPDQLQSHKI